MLSGPAWIIVHFFPVRDDLISLVPCPVHTLCNDAGVADWWGEGSKCLSGCGFQYVGRCCCYCCCCRRQRQLADGLGGDERGLELDGEHPREELPHGLKCFCPFSPSPAGYNLNRDSAFFLRLSLVLVVWSWCVWKSNHSFCGFYGSVGIEPKASHPQSKLYHWAVPSGPTRRALWVFLLGGMLSPLLL